jgi:lipopolysaccharide/colanic/teichoic acid biosynthesis glycosyltransferase
VLKRIFDIIFALFALIFLFPIFLLIALVIMISSRGSIFFIQKRVGKNFKEFNLIKFRSMKTNSERLGMLTIGENDSRVTKMGYYLRKYKLDELPQLINVLIGDMSFVGPRPEVKKYVDLYDNIQKKVLAVRPGITDYASLYFFEESKLLAKAKDAEHTYVHEIMPMKLKMNLEYIENASTIEDLKIIFKTIIRIAFK